MISAKMMELGCKKKIPGTACEKKWRDLESMEKNNLPPIQSPELSPTMEAIEMKRELSSISDHQLDVQDD